ncbi:MAG: hypothetical protein K2M37_06445 [Muribaculaceae bacterium]|nr:hypothetical protein [Muribaculaceae bacterium]
MNRNNINHISFSPTEIGRQEDSYNVIWNLISRFYDGVASPEECDRLCEFFRSSSNLPPDLEKHRSLFVMLDPLMDCELPDELSQRIDNRMESEFRLTRFSSGRKFRWISVACLFIAFIACGAALGLILWNNSVSVPSEGYFAGANDTDLPLSGNGSIEQSTLRDDTISPVYASVLKPAVVNAGGIEKKQTSESTTSRPPSNGKLTEKPSTISDDMETEYTSKYVKSESEPQEYLLNDVVGGEYCFTEEEQRLMAGNVQVITDPAEAASIVNSIFARMEFNLDVESVSVGKTFGTLKNCIL